MGEWNVVARNGTARIVKGSKKELREQGFEVLRTGLTERAAKTKAAKLQKCLSQRKVVRKAWADELKRANREEKKDG